MTDTQLLKKDLFGEIRLENGENQAVIVRDCATASLWVRGFARWMLRREADVLTNLDNLDGVPSVVAVDKNQLKREFLDGRPMQNAKPSDPGYFRDALRLLRRLHTAKVAHNDLAKEPNFLVRPDGSPAILDFQLAFCAPRRGRLFRLAAREDLRHLLKHKRQYCPDALTARQRALLQNPSVPSRIYARTLKPIYLFVTRRLLGWRDREGAGNRGDVA